MAFRQVENRRRTVGADLIETSKNDRCWHPRILSLSRVFFEVLWKRGDPWSLESSPFEQERYARQLVLLHDRRYSRALDFGCGSRQITRMFFRIADRVTALDISQTAIDRARGSGIDPGAAAFVMDTEEKAIITRRKTLRAHCCNIALALVFPLYAFSASAQDNRPPAGHARSLSVPNTDKAPVIDGKLDEEAWTKAEVASDFWISEQERWPAEKTEVLVLADKDHLYFGFRAYDSRPDGIEARQTRRDAGLGLDDQVVVELDPFHNHRQVSSYSLNAIGTQDDAIAGGRARNIQWKGDWTGAAARTEYGWSAEIAIPFEILNYDPGNTAFGVNFLRYHHRMDQWSRWADPTPQGKPEEMGHLAGLNPPSVGKYKEWTIMPYGLIGRKIPDKEGEIHDFLGTGGIDIRYEPRQNMTGVLSFNPDFSQLESQITNINFNYNEKFRADPRPFFQEGSAYFGSNNKFLYTNRIPDFDYGGKVFAQLGRYQLGGLVSEAPNSRWDMAFRLNRELGATNNASIMMVLTDREDLRNQLVAGQFGGRQPFGLNYGLDVAFTSTEKQKGNGEYVRGSIGWKWDYAWIGTDLDRYSVNFFPANGLLNRDLFGTRGISNYAGYWRDLGSGPFRVISGDIGWIGRETTGGLRQNETWYGDASIELRQQVKFGLFYSNGYYRPVGGEIGEWSDHMNHDRYWTASLDFNTRSSVFSYGASYSWGTLGGGAYGYLIPYFWIRPVKEAFLKATYERLHSFGTFDQTVVSGGWDITPKDGIVFRYILANHADFSRVGYSRQVRKGLNIFIVYDKEASQYAQFSVKLVMAIPFSFSGLTSSNTSGAPQPKNRMQN